VSIFVITIAISFAAQFVLQHVQFTLPIALSLHQPIAHMSLLLFSASVIIFLIGKVSEQITAFTYRRSS